MTYNLETLPKELEANVLFLYGDEVSDRSLPLSRRELALVKERRADKRDFLLVFDRLPYRLYLLSFDSEKPTSESQEGLRRSAMKVLKRLEEDKVADLTVTGEGILEDEMAAVVEGLTLADYSFDRYRSKECYHLATLTIDDRFMKPAALEASKRLWNRIFWCREWVNLPVQDLNAAAFADELQRIAADLEGVKCTVMDKKQIESLRMGGLLGVNRGSVDDPRFVVLEYNGVAKWLRTQPLSHSITQILFVWSARASCTTPAASTSSLATTCRK